jgi:uncharacterized protein YjiS (DUF1127 family)
MLQHFKGAVRGVSERARQRRVYRTLMQLDDHLLQDIGLPRDEIRARFRGEPHA